MKKHAIVAASLALLCGTAHPQTTFESTVTVVSLPLFVTDASGRAVAGLAQEDFEVLDDGKPAKIVGGVHVERAVAEGVFRWFVLGFTPEGVSPGEYTLRVRLRDPASGRVSESFRSVQVV